MTRLKDMGMIGLTLLLMLILTPITVLSFFITVHIFWYLLVGGVMLAALGYFLVLPTTAIASLTGNEDNMKFMAVGIGLTVIVIGGLLITANVRGNEAKAERRAQANAAIEAGTKARCTHPELDGHGNGTMTFPADMWRSAVRDNGWSCYIAGEVYAPPGQAPHHIEDLLP